MNTKIISILLGASFFFSCSEEIDTSGQQQEKEKITTTIRLAVPRSSQITTRTASSPDESESGLQLIYNEPVQTKAEELTDERESEITNLWVLQYDEESGRMISQNYITDLTEIEDNQYKVYEVDVNVVNSDHDLVFCFIANLGETDIFKTWPPLSEYQSMTHRFEDEESVTSGDQLIMTGTYWGPVPIDEKIPLERLVSKLALTVNYPSLTESFTVDSVQLVSVPVFGQYHNESWYGGDWIFPEREIENYIDYPLYAPEGGIANETRLVWYMPENRQGRAYINNAVEKTAEHDPSFAVTGTSLATRIVLHGTHNGTRIKITLYPGNNSTSDYNIIRNCNYNMTADIRRLEYGYDKRIEKYYPLKVEYYIQYGGRGHTFLTEDIIPNFALSGTIFDPEDERIIDSITKFRSTYRPDQFDEKLTQYIEMISSNEEENVIRFYFTIYDNV